MTRFNPSAAAMLLAASVAVALSDPISTTNLLLNPGGEAGSLLNWTAGGDSAPRLDSGTFDAGIAPHSGSYDFLGGAGVSGSLAQVVSLVGNQAITAAAIDNRRLLASVSFWEQSFNQNPADAAYISLTFFNSSSNLISSVATTEVAAAANLTWSNSGALFPIPAGTRYLQYTMNFIRHNGSDLDAFLDDNRLAVFEAALLPRLNSDPNSAAAIFWPTNFADGFVLQSTTNLASANWVASTDPVSMINGTNRITPPATAGSKFFRLSHP